jgi:hypothetical protein
MRQLKGIVLIHKDGRRKIAKQLKTMKAAIKEGYSMPTNETVLQAKQKVIFYHKLYSY